MANYWRKVKVSARLISRVGKDRFFCRKCGKCLLKEKEVVSHLISNRSTRYYHVKCYEGLRI